MRANAGIFIFISLLFLIGGVAGHLPDDSTIITSKPWVIANGVDQTTITVMVSNQSSGAVLGATVTLTIDNPLYGTLSPVTVISDSATSTFKANTTSGVAVITATITSPDGYTVTRTVTQNIDHDSPYYTYFSHPLTVEVDSQIQFNVSITDRHGNPIDDRKEEALSLPPHKPTFHVHGPAPDDCYFVDGGEHDISPAQDSHGNWSVGVNLTQTIGNNYVLMDPFGSISEKIEWIVVEATGKPYSMTGTISDGGILPVDTTPFIIDYFLYDQYGNPVRNQSIWVNTTPFNKQNVSTSNSRGQIRIYYGPLTTAGEITITATSIGNDTVTNQLVAHFVNSGPTNMVLAVTPQTMASLETLSLQKQAFVRATVIDNFGNPVPNESVSFSLDTVSAPGFTQTADPYLSSLSAITDYNGNAIVTFYPGEFAERGEPGYNGAATGNVAVTATWGAISRSVTATWKNYAYLSIIPSAEPRTIRLNETIDITLDVIGDGYNLQGGNVAAIMDLDSGSSIWSNKDMENQSLKRIDAAKEAAKAFASAMLTPPPTTNWIGVDSFGNEKKDDHRLLDPQNIYSLVENKINNLVRGTNSQGFGASIIDSINNLTATEIIRHPPGEFDKVRAVIVLKDSGGGNLDNNQHPNKEDVIALADSTSPKTMVFTVYYYDGISESSSTQLILQDLANSTGGKFFRSGNATQLKLDFLEIASILKTAAGVNASMALDIGTIEQNGTQVNGSSVFSYVPVGPFYDLDSTIVLRDTVQGRTRIFWPNSSHSVINQSDEWNSYKKLSFTIGTINLTERWNATYRLKAVNQTGLFNLFNCSMSGSTLTYNDNEENVCLPDLYIMITNTTPPPSQSGLDVWNLHVTKSGNFTDYVPLEWNLKYTGFNTTTETLWYSSTSEYGPWVQYDTRANIAPGYYTPHNGQLDVRNLPWGSYWVKVHAIAPDAMDSEDICGPIMVGYTGVFIKLT